MEAKKPLTKINWFFGSLSAITLSFAIVALVDGYSIMACIISAILANVFWNIAKVEVKDGSVQGKEG
jgi:hypothetical protein